MLTTLAVHQNLLKLTPHSPSVSVTLEPESGPAQGPPYCELHSYSNGGGGTDTPGELLGREQFQ